MYQIRTYQCSKFVNFNVADSAASMCQVRKAGLSYGPKHPPAEVYLDLPKPKPEKKLNT
jgi:hypothetical protein